MIIGIDGSRAFIKRRTGIEEYSYRTIEHLRLWLKDHEVVLYIRHNQEVDFDLPEKWKVKKLWLPYFTSQLRFSLEFLFHPVNALFVPAHTVPPIHPKNTVVVVHGLEYEFCPKAYSRWARFYMRTIIRNSCKWASRVVCVSENTKNDVMRLYGISADKITVVYEGYSGKIKQEKDANTPPYINKEDCAAKDPYLLFIGRIEERKNIKGIIESFEIIKKKYGVSHKLLLVGRPGYGYADVQKRIASSEYKKDIVEMGYVSDSEKWEILRCADVFVFPTYYEGFGLPILEAQNAMVPVVTSNVSSIPEVASGAALYADPDDHSAIAENIYVLIINQEARNAIIKRGYENVRRFSWSDCAKEISGLLKEKR